MSCTGWRVDSKSLFDDSIKVLAFHERFRGDLIQVLESGAHFVLKATQSRFVVAEVISNSSQECCGSDSACHHDHVEMGAHFKSRWTWTFGRKDVVREVFSGSVDFEAPRNVNPRLYFWGGGGGWAFYASVCSVAYSACLYSVFFM